MSPFVATTRAPEPEPEPVPGPAFRGRRPRLPRPNRCSTRRAGSSPVAVGATIAPPVSAVHRVLSAPIVAMPMPPPAAAPLPGIPARARRRVSVRPPPAAGLLNLRSTASRRPAGRHSRTAAGGHGHVDVGADCRAGDTPTTCAAPDFPQLAGAALPGVAGILLMTFGGGVIGYRQASAGRMIRSSGCRALPAVSFWLGVSRRARRSDP